MKLSRTYCHGEQLDRRGAKQNLTLWVTKNNIKILNSAEEKKKNDVAQFRDSE